MKNRIEDYFSDESLSKLPDKGSYLYGGIITKRFNYFLISTVRDAKTSPGYLNATLRDFNSFKELPFKKFKNKPYVYFKGSDYMILRKVNKKECCSPTIWRKKEYDQGRYNEIFKEAKR